MPSLKDQPIKCLVKSMTTWIRQETTIRQAHGLLPRLIWPLILYEIPTTAAEVLERTVSKDLRRWLGVPPSFTNIELYGKTTLLKVPLSFAQEEFKVSKKRLDQLVRQAGIERRTDRKSSTSQAEKKAEHRDIFGTPSKGRMGLGNSSKQSQWKTEEPQERRAMI